MLVVISCHVRTRMARDLRETRIYILNTALENRTTNHPPTNTAYVSQYSDTRARWLKHVYRHLVSAPKISDVVCAQNFFTWAKGDEADFASDCILQ